MEKRRKRLARSGWGGDQGMVTLTDGVPSLGLSRRGLSQGGFEPLNDGGVERERLHERKDTRSGRGWATRRSLGNSLCLLLDDRFQHALDRGVFFPDSGHQICTAIQVAGFPRQFELRQEFRDRLGAYGTRCRLERMRYRLDLLGIGGANGFFE